MTMWLHRGRVDMEVQAKRHWSKESPPPKGVVCSQKCGSFRIKQFFAKFETNQSIQFYFLEFFGFEVIYRAHYRISDSLREIEGWWVGEMRSNF